MDADEFYRRYYNGVPDTITVTMPREAAQALVEDVEGDEGCYLGFEGSKALEALREAL